MALIPPLVMQLGLDAIQLLVCGIILIYLIRSRHRFQRRSGNQAANTGSTSFGAEVMLQVVKQQAERSFETISETLRHERRLFDQFLDQYPWGSHGPGRPLDAVGSSEPFVKPDTEDSLGGREVDTLEINRLNREGMGLSQIAERMKIPLEEVQLRLRLSNQAAKPNAKRRTPHG